MKNEPLLQYGKGSPERARLIGEIESQYKQLSSQPVEIPIVIDGKEIKTGNFREVRIPHEHRTVIARFHLAGEKELRLAAQACAKSKADWMNRPQEERLRIFEKAGDLLAGTWRMRLNAATMLGQSKTVHQAEIDSACELIDFFRMNAHFVRTRLREELISPEGFTNELEWRPLEGFIFAITPFNFTAIAANLPSAPAMLGNTVIWKPSDTQMLSAWISYLLLREAGLPDGVIQFCPADGPLAGKTLLSEPTLGGVHFTGSTATFRSIWKEVAQNLENYREYPRLVGETGGKDFVFAHPSADVTSLASNLIRGAFEFQGQKCSAASRTYIPASLWPKVKEKLLTEIPKIKVGDVRDLNCFMGAVIDERSFRRIEGTLTRARSTPGVEFLIGGGANAEKGWFIEPTVLVTNDPKSETMTTEIFGPVLTAYVYDDRKLEETISLCDSTSPYALTGAIFAEDEKALTDLQKKLRFSAGNLYINDKPTGAVVGQQPFGGGRASGTNDKAGSFLNLVRWISPRTIKISHVPLTDWRYPFLG